MATAFANAGDFPLHRGQRDHARARLNVPIRLVTFSGTEPCTLVDLSCTGAKIAAEQCPRVGGMVVVEGIPIELFGTVRWSRQGYFGVEFERALAAAQVVELRHYADLETARQKAAQIEYARGWVTGIYSYSR